MQRSIIFSFSIVCCLTLLLSTTAYASEIIKARNVLGKNNSEAVVINFVKGENPSGWKYVGEEYLTEKDLPTFKDLEDQDELPAAAKASILRNAFHNTVGGYGDATFRPGNHVSRAEFISIAVRAFDTYYDDTLQSVEDIDAGYFKDMEGHWAQVNATIAQERNWIRGYKNRTFRPEENINHAEALVVLNRIARDYGREFASPREENGDADSAYSFGEEHVITIDFAEGSFSKEVAVNVEEEFAMQFEPWDWAYDAIKNFALEGIISHEPLVDREFNPEYNLTRVEAAVLIDALKCNFERQMRE